MAEMILYHAPGTRSVRVLWALRELGLPHRVVSRPLAEYVGDPAWRELNPAARLPWLVDGELRLSESLVILHHLFEARAPGSPLWRPPGHPERIAMLHGMHYAETVQVHLQVLNQQFHFIRPPQARSAATVKLEQARLRRSLAWAEGEIGPHQHLLEGGFSAADLCFGYALAATTAFRPLDEFPRLAAYLQRVRTRPAAAGLLDHPAVTAPLLLD